MMIPPAPAWLRSWSRRPRLGASLSLPAPLPRAPCFTVFMETLSVLTPFLLRFSICHFPPCSLNCSSLSCLISLLSLLSLSSVHNFLLAYCHNLFLFFCCLKPFFVFFCHFSISSLVPTEPFFLLPLWQYQKWTANQKFDGLWSGRILRETYGRYPVLWFKTKYLQN